MTTHNLLPKHGEEFTIEVADARRRFREIEKLQVSASLELSVLIMMGRQENGRVKFPCKQCLSDIALQFHDLSEAIRELAK